MHQQGNGWSFSQAISLIVSDIFASCENSNEFCLGSKTKSGTGAMAQSTKCLPDKREDLSSGPHHSHKKLGMAGCTCSSSARKVKTDASGEFNGQQLSPNCELQVQQRSCLKTEKNQVWYGGI